MGEVCRQVGSATEPEASTSRRSREWPRAGRHPSVRGQEAISVGHRPRRTPITLPDEAAHRRRHSCYSKPFAAQSLWKPEESGHSSQHQTYPHQPIKDHIVPGVRVWCPVPRLVLATAALPATRPGVVPQKRRTSFHKITRISNLARVLESSHRSTPLMRIECESRVRPDLLVV